ncbi:MAG: glycosyltransferase [Pirellulales bacterium]|nr:glycosyltransferase [Pirellulales bacterium]
MPTYNGGAYVEAALGSLCAQEERDFEVIAVDDGSADDTPGILERCAERLPLKIVRRAHTGNWVAGTNVGMGLAQGRYLCWLHQDDLWCAGRAAHLKRLVSQWPEAVLFLQPAWYIDAAGKRVGCWRPPLPRRSGPVPSELVRGRLLVQDFLAASAPAFQAEAARRMGGMDERLWYAGDWDFWLKLGSAGPVVYDPLPRVAFRLHRESQTWTRTGCREEMVEQHRIVLSRHIGSCALRGLSEKRLRRVATFSADLNIALMRLAAGAAEGWGRLGWDFVRLGPWGWRTFFRDSRILDRVASRLRAGLAQADASPAVGVEHEARTVVDAAVPTTPDPLFAVRPRES